MAKKIFINGFGRIGRCVVRILSEQKGLKLVGINDIYDIDQAVYLLKYDSVFGEFSKRVEKIDDRSFWIGDQKVLYTQFDNIDFLSSFDDIDLLLECSGVYKKSSFFEPFVDKNIKKVLFAFVPSDNTPVYIMGVNEDSYSDEKIISNSSCTANCLAPVLKMINKYSNINRVYATTIHSYTSDQKLLDSKYDTKDIRRCRASNINIIPVTSGVAYAVGQVLPFIKDKIKGYSIRVPVENVTMIDLSLEFKNNIDLNHFIDYLQQKIKSSTYIQISKEPLVSRDIIKSPRSAIIDLDLIALSQKNFLKMMLWQDNEWGYATRLVDMAKHILKVE